MKIRKLILKAKLQQIEKQYQYVFIYHCSGLTNPQWRQLKDLLYKTHGKTFFQPNSRQKKLGLSSLPKNASTLCIHPVRGRRHQSLARPGGEFAMNQLNSKLDLIKSGPFCIFYLRSCVGIIDTHQSTPSWSEVVKKIDSLGYNTNLVLLYAQIQSTIVNHIDIKQALNLETSELYQQFLWSTQYPVQSLDFCLHQNINQLDFLEVLGHRHGGGSDEEQGTGQSI